MTQFLRRNGYHVNRKKIQKLMRKLGLAGIAPGPNTSKKHPENKIYPYLLRVLRINTPNQVWSTDITYIRLAHGFVYLVAIMDWYSRKILAWRVSNTMDSSFCVECLDEALRNYPKPEIFNTDQGSQFTNLDFTGLLLAHDILISMDGRGRALDNIFIERLWRTLKYEDIYIKDYVKVPALIIGLTIYMAFYNTERQHQSLCNNTPDVVYATGLYGGASIPDLFGKNKESLSAVIDAGLCPAPRDI